jgi:hypothetical protein
MFHAEFAYLFVMYLHIKFNLPVSNGLLVITIKPKTKQIFHGLHVIVLQFYKPEIP